MYNIYQCTPQGTKTNFASIDVGGSNIQISNSRASDWLKSATALLGTNGNAKSSYPIVQPQWAVDLIAALPA